MIIDTNIILRYLLRDNEPQFLDAQALFSGTETLEVTDVTVFECVYILGSSLYNKSREQIAESLLIVLSLDVVEYSTDNINRSLRLFEATSLDFAACYLICLALKTKQSLKTYDKKMLKTYESLKLER